MSDQIIDLPEVLERVQDDKSFLVELLDIFEEDFLKKRAALGQAVAAKDLAKIKEVAHSMKGSSGNVSAKRIYASCLALEKIAKDNSTAGMDELVKAIDAQFAEVRQFTVDFKKELGG